MNNWISILLQIVGRQNFFDIFDKRRNNRGIIWASLVGLGISAAAFGLRKSGKRKLMNPLQNIMYDSPKRNATPILVTEFSKELVPYKGSLKK